MTEVIADLGYRPRRWQAEARASFKRFNVMVVHRRGGKTMLADVTLVDAALRTEKKDARYGYIAPYRKQAKEIAWTYTKHFARKIPDTRIYEGDLKVVLPNAAEIQLYGADDPERLRGIYLDGAVVDELKDIKPELWTEILPPCLSDRKGWALFIGTPKGINLLSELYFHALTDPEWYAGLYKWNDTGALDEDEIALQRRIMPEARFRQEYECDFSASAEDNLITIDLAEEASRRAPQKMAWEGSPRILGVDVARYGNDRSVIFPRQGLVAFRPKVFEDIDNMSLASEVAKMWHSWEAQACFIDAGRGEGVIDRLRQLGYAPVPVNFGGTKGVRAGYANKRSEMWGLLAEWLREGGAIPDMPELRADLCTPKMDWGNARNLLMLESKDKIRDRGLPSPDLGDALALTFAAPVRPKLTPVEMEAPWLGGKGRKLRTRSRYRMGE